MKRSPTRRILAAVGALTLASWLAASAASAQAAPGYLADDYHQLALGSNQFMSGAKFVGKSYPVQLSPKTSPESYGPIWKFSCPAAAETVKFSRSVWLPGPPNYGGEFTYGSALGQNELSKLSTIDLIVNGNVIVHEPLPSGNGVYRVPVSGAALNAFHYGNNTITASVVKLKTSGTCNTGNPATQLGVVFELEGQFQTDLALNPPEPITYHKLAPGTTYADIVTVNFRNQGPAWEPNGMFQVNVDGAQYAYWGNGTGSPAPGPPLTNCQQSNNGSSYIFQCGLSDFAPFTAGAVGVNFSVTAPPGPYTDFSVVYQVYISAGTVTDLNSSNDTTNHTWVFCGTQSTNPGCQGAS